MRKDPVNGRWVVIAPDRAGRPNDFQQSPTEGTKADVCPFCPGNEQETPPEIAAIRPKDTAPNTPGWQARLVPNRYPALSFTGEAEAKGDDLHQRMAATGSHEVLIETPDHEQGLAEMETAHIAEMLLICRNRMATLLADRRIAHVMLFKNHGAKAGASLSHSHSQLVALPVVPKHVMEELVGAEQHHQEHGTCLYCRMVEDEEKDGKRIVATYEHFTAFTAWAPRKPYETWIAPRTHRHGFQQVGDDEVNELALVLKQLVGRMNQLLGNPPFNLVLHTSPAGDEHRDSYHWHMELLPEFTWIAGFEWGAGVYISHVTPEQAAEKLRGKPTTS